MNRNLHEIKDFMINVSFKAGEIIKKFREENELNISTTHKSKSQIVTPADLASEKAIIEEILKKFPNDKILSEETSKDLKDDIFTENYWVIDPIDGTTSYRYGSNNCSVSIGYMEEGEIKIGIIYIPFTGETYLAIKNEGAFYSNKNNNFKKFMCPNNVPVSEAVIGLGWPQEWEIQGYLGIYKYVSENFLDYYRAAGATIDMCQVAKGILHGYYETSLAPWDVAAAFLILKEAGAKVSFLNEPKDKKVPRDIYSKNVLVTPANIHDEIFKAFSEIISRN